MQFQTMEYSNLRSPRFTVCVLASSPEGDVLWQVFPPRPKETLGSELGDRDAEENASGPEVPFTRCKHYYSHIDQPKRSPDLHNIWIL